MFKRSKAIARLLFIITLAITHTAIAADNDVMAPSNQEDESEEEQCKPTSLTDTPTNVMYGTIAGATVSLIDENGKCHGVVVNYRNTIIILTAAHCLQEKGRLIKGKVWISEYYGEPSQNKAPYIGYGYIWENQTPLSYSAKQITVHPEWDIGYISGVLKATKDIIERAVKIAPDTPESGQLIFSTHWQYRCWETPDGECSKGELLFPNLGIARDLDPQSYYHSYSIPFFGGDSGSGIINGDGQLVGILSGSVDDIVNEPFWAIACTPKSIRSFLDSTW